MSEEKSYIYYRFVHDVSAFKRLEFLGSKIPVRAVRDIIAKANGIEKEYKKTFNLQIYEYNASTDGISDVELNCDILANTKCIVKRVLWHEKDALQHVAETTLEKKPFPNEYLCQICFDVLVQPVILRCANKCGKTICRLCAEAKLETNNNLCPFCNQNVTNIVPNKILSEIINELNMAEFDLSQPSLKRPQLNSNVTKLPLPNEPLNNIQELAFLFPLLKEKDFNYLKRCQECLKKLLVTS